MLLKINHVSFPGLGIDDMELNTNALSLFGGKIEVAWYAVIILTGIIFSFFYVLRRFKEVKFTSDDLIDLALFAVLGGVLGARIYYVIFEFGSYVVNTGHFWHDVGQTLLGMIAIWNGGLAIYGAVIGGATGAALVARRKKWSILQIFDFLAPAVMLSQAIGRWGNFINAEAHGGETSLPWRMGIYEHGVWNYYHPAFLYESLWNLIGFLIIHFVFVKKHKKFNGQIFYMYMAWYGFGRMFIEGLRTDSLYIGIFRVSQLVGIVTFIVGTSLLVYNYLKLRKAKENEQNN